MFGSRLYRSATFVTRSALRRGTVTTPRPPTASPGGRRSYMYRVINHQRLILSWNAIRIWVRNPMFPYHLAGIGLFCGVFYLYHLERAPLSGRYRFNMISVHWEEQLGRAWFNREMEKNRESILSRSTDEHCKVWRVLDRLLSHSSLDDEAWEVHVIDNPSISAFVLPGGKVFVNRGMLDLCAREDELAIVLGHEIAHNMTRHASERLSRSLILIPVVLLGWLASGIDEDLVQLAIDVAFQLPHSRAHEKEADHFGLLLTAQSGYDPSAALDLWSRWEALEADDIAPFLRTHPSHHDRLTQFYYCLGEARRKRLPSTLGPQTFSEAYCLQRSFCGIERNVVDNATLPSGMTRIYRDLPNTRREHAKESVRSGFVLEPVQQQLPRSSSMVFALS